MIRSCSSRAGAGLATIALVLGSGTCVRADVGDAAPLAIAAVQARPIWRNVVATTGHVGGDPSAPTSRTWERDAEPEERRYEIVIENERSARETFGGAASAANDPYARAGRGLRAGVSAATYADFRSASKIATVANTKLELAQTFFRGKKWAYVAARSTATVHSTTVFVWTQIPRANLASELRAANACARTGECGE